MKTFFLNVSLKAKIFIFSSLSFIVAILSYYLFYVSLEKSSGQFCKTHYCLALIPTEGYIAIVLGVISLIAVVVSLDAWKIGQKYLENKEKIESTIQQLSTINNLYLNCYFHTMGHPNAQKPDYQKLYFKIGFCHQKLIECKLSKELLDKYNEYALDAYGNFCNNEDRKNENLIDKHNRVAQSTGNFTKLISDVIIPALNEKNKL